MALARIQIRSAVGIPARITADSVDYDGGCGWKKRAGYAQLRGLLIVGQTSNPRTLQSAWVRWNGRDETEGVR
jgi:hypothetical protein